jgi:uncharacterized membrane protein YeaQ/YmgE (transglycosylase-associated protein family)
MFSGHGFGYVGDIILGLAGASIAGLLLPGVFPVGFAGQMISAAMGALIILSMISVVKRR